MGGANAFAGRLDDLLDDLAVVGRPGSGVAAAVTAALAASLAAGSARASPDWSDGPTVAAAADRLRACVGPIARANAASFAAAATATAAEPARSAAALTPMQIAYAAADIASLAANAAEACDRSVLGDAVAAAMLAAGAAAAAAQLVKVNATVHPDDERDAQASAVERRANQSAARAAATLLRRT